MAISDFYPGIRPGTPYTSVWQRLLDDLRTSGIAIDPMQSGGFNPRNIAGTNTPSLHASDRAYDVNWNANPVGSMPGPARPDARPFDPMNMVSDAAGDRPGQTQIPAELARAVAAANGLRWGGDFQGRSPDPMHFEVAGGPPAPMAQRSMTAAAGLTPPPGGGFSPEMLASVMRALQPQGQSPTPTGVGSDAARAPDQSPIPSPSLLERLQAFGDRYLPLPAWTPPEGDTPPPETVVAERRRGFQSLLDNARGVYESVPAWSPPDQARSAPAPPPAPFGVPTGIGSDAARVPGQPDAGPPGVPPFGAETTPAPQPDADAIVSGARAAHSTVPPYVAPQEQPGFAERLMSNPAFLAGLSILGTAPGGNWGPAGAQAFAQAQRSRREQEQYQRQQQQRANMDRIWGEAFPNGQPNLQHPLLAGQSPQVAAMIAGLGPEAALPLLAKSAMERRQLELKDIGGQGVIFNPTTGATMAVPGTQGGKPPAGYRWAEGQPGQLEPIPGGPGEHIAAEVAGRLAIMRTAKPGMAAAREFFTRRWGPGEIARNTMGGGMIAPEYDRHRRTVRLAVEGSLRAMTGAAAPESEVRQYMEMFMPKVTDPPEIARQKLGLLDQFMTNAEEVVTRGRRPAGGQQPQQGQRRRYDPATGELSNAN